MIHNELKESDMKSIKCQKAYSSPIHLQVTCHKIKIFIKQNYKTDSLVGHAKLKFQKHYLKLTIIIITTTMMMMIMMMTCVDIFGAYHNFIF